LFNSAYDLLSVWGEKGRGPGLLVSSDLFWGELELKAAIYARVSTKGQEVENQLIVLRQWMTDRGFEPVEFIDRGYSGSLAEDKRPALADLMSSARKRRFKMVVVWDFSRFARSLKQLVLALEEFHSLGIDFASYQQNIDTSTPSGKMMFGIIGCLAEFERAMIRERVMAGLSRARSQGKTLGRPRFDVDVLEIMQMRTNGKSLRQIAQDTGINRGKIFRTVKLMSQVSHNPIQK
jgi:DNA invertase Pin-like site-specific DNA recombinase